MTIIIIPIWCERVEKMFLLQLIGWVCRINTFVFAGLRPLEDLLIWRNDIITARPKKGITRECADKAPLMVAIRTSAASQAAPSHPDKQTHRFLVCSFWDEGFSFKAPSLNLNRAVHLVRCVNTMTHSWVVPKATCLIWAVSSSTNLFYIYPVS